MPGPPERVVIIRPRTIILVLGVTFLVTAGLLLFYLAWHVISWILIAAFLAMALNPAVEFFVRRGRSRGTSSADRLDRAIAVLTALGFLLIPPLVHQITDFVDAVPDLVPDLTEGRGRLGFLERDYHLVERVREAIEDRGAAGVLGITEPAARDRTQRASPRSSGRDDRVPDLLHASRRADDSSSASSARCRRSRGSAGERIGEEIYKTVGGYVTGNLVISVIAGVATTIALFASGMPTPSARRRRGALRSGAARGRDASPRSSSSWSPSSS